MTTVSAAAGHHEIDEPLEGRLLLRPRQSPVCRTGERCIGATNVRGMIPSGVLVTWREIADDAAKAGGS
jgi:hypothetical protein